MPDSAPPVALLLAAGLGTRLRPITDKIPKCLIPVNGVPLLKRWVDSVRNAGIERVVINTHYKSDQVVEFLSNQYPGASWLEVLHEPSLLGTAGTTLQLVNKSIGEFDRVFVIHADNYWDEDFSAFVEFQKQLSNPHQISLVCFHTDDHKSSGIFTVSQDGIPTGYHEKKNTRHGYLANGAIYCFPRSSVIKLFPNKTDIAAEIIPLVFRDVAIFITDKEFLDIGKLATYASRFPDDYEVIRNLSIERNSCD